MDDNDLAKATGALQLSKEAERSSLMPKKYTYAPLTEPGSIRLVDLEPSLRISDPVFCNIIHTTLGVAGVTPTESGLKHKASEGQNAFSNVGNGYTALSYTWGDATYLETITESCHFSLSITANLDSALRNIRLKTQSVRLWVDALCIDQTNVEERNHQVSQMCSIYSNAASTIIYLGDTNALSASTFEHYRRGESSTEIKANDILARSWFTRVWVFQEAVVSKTLWVHCGPSALPWKKLSSGLRRSLRSSMRKIPSHSRSPSRNSGTLDSILSIISARESYHGSYASNFGKSLNLLDFLRQRRGFQATDSRDIIFGLAAVLPAITVGSRGQTIEFLVDYAKTCKEVYHDTAAQIMSACQDYRILSCADTSSRYHSQDSLASWVPDWRHSNYYTIWLSQFGDLKTGQYSVSKQDRLATIDYMLSDNSGNTLLCCRGEQPWDSIRSVSPVLDLEKIPSKLFTGTSRLSNRRVRQNYEEWRKLLGDEVLPPYDLPSNGRSAYAISSPDTPFFLTKSPGSTFDVTGFQTLQILWKSSTTDQEVLHERRIAVTERGKIGLVSSRATAGDQICLLKGSNIFFVFHPLEADSAAIPPTLSQDLQNHFSTRISGFEHCKYSGECLFDGTEDLLQRDHEEIDEQFDRCYILH